MKEIRNKEACEVEKMKVIHATWGRDLLDEWGSESPLAAIYAKIRLKGFVQHLGFHSMRVSLLFIQMSYTRSEVPYL